MRILVTGANGMLGQDVVRVVRARGHEVTASDLPEVDITDPASCKAAIAEHDWVVNTAAYTAVDEAETNEAMAFHVNAVGPSILARVAHRAGARMVHISTDYVFAGDAKTPYAEDASLAPKSAYGRTKAAGEWAVRAECPESIIVRTAWLYGPGGPNFVKTMARLAGERESVSVVNDQTGQPTASVDLATFIVALIESDSPAGVYHGTSEGETTWFGFTQAIFEDLGLDPHRVLPTTSEAFVRAAPRPAYSVLGHERARALGVPQLPHWRAALRSTFPDIVRSA
jgi:dTDP-4-dehydrorhamnose reductase